MFRYFDDARNRSSSVALVYNDFFGGRFGLMYYDLMRVYKGKVGYDIPVARDINGNLTRYQGEASLESRGKEQDFKIFFNKNLLIQFAN